MRQKPVHRRAAFPEQRVRVTPSRAGVAEVGSAGRVDSEIPGLNRGSHPPRVHTINSKEQGGFGTCTASARLPLNIALAAAMVVYKGTTISLIEIWKVRTRPSHFASPGAVSERLRPSQLGDNHSDSSGENTVTAARVKRVPVLYRRRATHRSADSRLGVDSHYLPYTVGSLEKAPQSRGPAS